MLENPWYKSQVKVMFDKASYSILKDIPNNCKGPVIRWDEFRTYQVFFTQNYYIDYNSFKFDFNCKEITPQTFVLIFNDN